MPAIVRTETGTEIRPGCCWVAGLTRSTSRDPTLVTEQNRSKEKGARMGFIGWLISRLVCKKCGDVLHGWVR